MSKDWSSDIHEMHEHYGFHKAVNDLDADMKRDYLEFRKNFIKEELNELEDAIVEGNSEEVVDALIDICVVAIGTLDVFSVDAHKAWDEVHKANMAKEVGIKETRPNPLGLPDLIKPSGWTAPNHNGNHGDIPFD